MYINHFEIQKGRNCTSHLYGFYLLKKETKQPCSHDVYYYIRFQSGDTAHSTLGTHYICTDIILLYTNLTVHT